MRHRADRIGRLSFPVDAAGASGGGGSEASSAAVVLDPDAIERLRQLDPSGTQGMVERVLRAYLGSLQSHLDQIDAAPDDQQLLVRTAHTLKSSSAAVGAMDFSRRCAEVEHQIRQQQTLPSPSQLQALIQEGRRVLAAVEAMLAP